ncbi:CaiB/BaiF CoA transferase family protein [Arthrobacter globiformis]|uniref:CaiB/BaiF CoA transferase family protein n=1 Tax=Arthrobacter globiformis TaxID=1665 RepID=UPI002791DA4A|nr:CaiB/BaiF CoA-transferase family protein [Arthrobacter globiformis]MDQ0616663.1 crotonobetainyl-CoA:carnitine CoA-transferase CaiB-like acyl-CoA transferase [Arthrobacter globiformis]
MERVTDQLAEPPIQPMDWLSGIRVVEVTIGVSSPLNARILADLGAEVIRVESKAKPDVNRTRLKRKSEASDVPSEETFGLLHEANAGKKSITLNLKTEEGPRLLMKLLGTADVFVQNFVPGWLERLGLSIEEIRATYPRLIVLSASCYGQEGPYRDQRAYAPVMTSLAGVEGLIGYEDGAVQGTMASALADMNASFVGGFGILSALWEREHTGRGRHLDLSQTEAAAILTGEATVEWQSTGRVPGPCGNSGMSPGPWHMIKCGPDNWVGVTGLLPEELDAVTRAADSLGSEELHQWCLDRGIEAAVVAPSGGAQQPVLGESSRLAQTVSHPLIGPMLVSSLPWQLDGSIARLSGGSPLLGEHTREVLAGTLGIADDEIDRLAANGVLT